MVAEPGLLLGGMDVVLLLTLLLLDHRVVLAWYRNLLQVRVRAPALRCCAVICLVLAGGARGPHCLAGPFEDAVLTLLVAAAARPCPGRRLLLLRLRLLALRCWSSRWSRRGRAGRVGSLPLSPGTGSLARTPRFAKKLSLIWASTIAGPGSTPGRRGGCKWLGDEQKCNMANQVLTRIESLRTASGIANGKCLTEPKLEPERLVVEGNAVCLSGLQE